MLHFGVECTVLGLIKQKKGYIIKVVLGKIEYCTLKIKKILGKDVKEMKATLKDLLSLEKLANKVVELKVSSMPTRKEDCSCDTYCGCDNDCGCHDCSTQGCRHND